MPCLWSRKAFGIHYIRLDTIIGASIRKAGLTILIPTLENYDSRHLNRLLKYPAQTNDISRRPSNFSFGLFASWIPGSSGARFHRFEPRFPAFPAPHAACRRICPSVRVRPTVLAQPKPCSMSFLFCTEMTTESTGRSLDPVSFDQDSHDRESAVRGALFYDIF